MHVEKKEELLRAIGRWSAKRELGKGSGRARLLWVHALCLIWLRKRRGEGELEGGKQRPEEQQHSRRSLCLGS